MQFIKSIIKKPSIFLMAQQSEWYPQFLKPVAETVISITRTGKLLDVGTGPGMLPALLKENSNLQIIGTDINSSMIIEAKKKVNSRNVSFYIQDENTFKDFSDSTFDIVTFCSVLFLLSEETKNNILNEVSRILKPSGKIIVLTPSTRKSFFSTLKDIWLFPFSKYNWTFFVWKRATSNRANIWHNEKWLYYYSKENHFEYTISNVFYNYATLEIIKKQ